MGDLIKLAALWENQSKAGNTYLVGDFNPNIKLLLFRNAYKQIGDNRPDWIAYLAPKESEIEKGGVAEPPGPVTDDEIPF